MVALGAAFLVLAPACGDDSAGGGDGELTVSAASSLTEAFQAYGESLPGEQRFSFAGSDQLAAQLRQGARSDLIASADTNHLEELSADGLVAAPVVFARNELVIAVGEDAAITRIQDLTAPSLDIVIGAEGVPVGDYTREVLGRLSAGEREAILANVRSEESDVKGVIAKVSQGAADAGFVYASDVTAAAGDVREVGIPARLEPRVAYGIAVVTGAPNPDDAQAFVDGLFEGEGAEALAEAGFQPAPG